MEEEDPVDGRRNARNRDQPVDSSVGFKVGVPVVFHMALPKKKATWLDFVPNGHEPDGGVGLDGENVDERRVLYLGAQARFKFRVGRLDCATRQRENVNWRLDGAAKGKIDVLLEGPSEVAKKACVVNGALPA